LVHADEVKRMVARPTLAVGLQRATRAEFERARAAMQMLRIQVVAWRALPTT
jgi:hypothetical protein